MQNLLWEKNTITLRYICLNDPNFMKACTNGLKLLLSQVQPQRDIAWGGNLKLEIIWRNSFDGKTLCVITWNGIKLCNIFSGQVQIDTRGSMKTCEKILGCSYQLKAEISIYRKWYIFDWSQFESNTELCADKSVGWNYEILFCEWLSSWNPHRQLV